MLYLPEESKEIFFKLFGKEVKHYILRKMYRTNTVWDQMMDMLRLQERKGW